MNTRFSKTLSAFLSRKQWLALWREPAVAAALVLGVLLIALVALPGVRLRVADNLTAAEVLLYGDLQDDAPGNSAKPGGGGQSGSTFKKIVTAPVRLVARLFRGRSHDDTARKQEKDFKAAVIHRTRDGVPGESTVTASVEGTSLEAAAANLFDDAISLREKGRADAAIEKLVSSLTLNPNHAEAYNLLAVCYDEKGQYKHAQTEYRKALKVAPNNERYQNNFGYSYYLAGDFGNAVKWFRKGLVAAPNDKRMHNNLGLAYGRKGEFDNARKHFETAVGEIGANLNMGYIYSLHGKFEEAIKNYELALQAQPNSLPALGNLAQLYERTGRLREAAVLNEQYKKLMVSRDAAMDREQ